MQRRLMPLPPGQPRCPEPRVKPCLQSGQCMRAQAPYEQGRPVKDYSDSVRDARGQCVWIVRMQDALTPAPQGRVHDAPEGLR